MCINDNFIFGLFLYPANSLCVALITQLFDVVGGWTAISIIPRHVILSG